MSEYVNFELIVPCMTILITEDSNLFSKIDLSIFDEPFLGEVDICRFSKEVKEDVNLGC